MKVRIESVERLNNSYYGNPRWRVSWSEHGWSAYGSAVTAADSSYNYDVGEKGMRAGDFVEIELNGRGTIKSIKAVTS
jgi:hypothetical protein